MKLHTISQTSAKKIREDIIDIQRWVALNVPEPRCEETKQLVIDLNRVRSALEIMMCRGES